MCKLTDSRICAPRVTWPLSKSQRTSSRGTGRTRLGINTCALRHGYRCDWQPCFYERTSEHPRRALHSEQRTDNKSAVGGASSWAPVHRPPVNTDTHTHTDTPSTGLADEQPVTNGRRQSKRDATALHLFKLEKAANYGDQKTVVRENDIIILW